MALYGIVETFGIVAVLLFLLSGPVIIFIMNLRNINNYLRSRNAIYNANNDDSDISEKVSRCLSVLEEQHNNINDKMKLFENNFETLKNRQSKIDERKKV